ncbi:DUF5719 family protein [Nocardioides stalactiti]|uniref:DUF5719 family protein n=1 Tax=Nocardioides stalactiti TaxID=2755356 RepID=UPI0016015FDA|nr:DUF5719 family protein [Nocardioides stalactiti]
MTQDQPGDQSGRRADRETAPGRRGIVRRHRVDLLVVLAMLLPTAVVGALALLDGEDSSSYTQAPPSSARLTDASVVCAAAASSTAGDVVVSRVPHMRGGEVAVRVAEGGAEELGVPRQVDVRSGDLTLVRTDGDVLVTGEEAAAPGLVAGRTGAARAAAECRAPTFDEWYVGIGAAAKQASVVELVNPDDGPAVVEIALYGHPGLVIENDLRGIRVPGHTVMRIDLARATPRRGTLAAHLTVVRGRVVTTVRHTYDPLGQGTPRTDFLPAQAEPSTSNLLLGVPSDADGTLHLFNPGTDEVRATVRVVSDQATFTPAGLDEIEVPGGTVRQVALSDVLTKEASEGALGLQVVSAQPLVTSVRVLGADLGLIAPTSAVDQNEVTTAVVPVGPKALVLAGASRSGVVRVTAVAADGRVLLDEKLVEVGAERGHRLRLPDDAVLVTIDPKNTPIAGTVVLTGDRLGVLRLRPAEIDAEVPVVRPR